MRDAIRLARSSGEGFNLFEVLALRRREYVHSNVLAWLLDPLETHGLGVSFLNGVLGKVGAPTCRDEDKLRCRIRREVSAPTSIIDISVETPGSLLIIENKIDAVEGAEQTLREYKDFSRQANGRKFTAIFLSVNGESPQAENFIAWDYSKIWKLLCELEPKPAVASFIHDYRDAVEVLLAREGKAMARFKGYRPETKFILEHYEDVRLLKDAIDSAESDLAELLASIESELQGRDWWDEGVWVSGTQRGEIWARKTSWGTADESFWIGIFNVSLDRMMSEDDRPWSYVQVRNDMRTEPVRAKLAAVGRTIDVKADSSMKKPFSRYLNLAPIAADPGKLKDTVLAEFDMLAKFAPAIDDLVVPKGSKR